MDDVERRLATLEQQIAIQGALIEAHEDLLKIAGDFIQSSVEDTRVDRTFDVINKLISIGGAHLEVTAAVLDYLEASKQGSNTKGDLVPRLAEARQWITLALRTIADFGPGPN